MLDSFKYLVDKTLKNNHDDFTYLRPSVNEFIVLYKPFKINVANSLRELNVYLYPPSST